ncbi:MAG: ribonuclease R [Erysipelotrichales bacterium]|nr:ribonuclease R [Erysipelotrichales bacterium]
MKEKILQILSGASDPLSASKIEARLGVKTAKQFTLMMKALNKLVQEERIERIDDRFYRLKDEPKVPSAEGVLHLTKAGNGFIDLDNESVFIPYTSVGDAMDRDLVRIGFYYGTPIVEEVLKRAHTHVAGILIKRRKSLYLRPDDRKIPEDIRITNPSAYMKHDGMKASVKITSYGYPMEGTVDRILGESEDRNAEIYSILADHEIFREFPKDVLREADAIPEELSEKDLAGRKDLTGVLHITIDGETAKDFDDAVSLSKNADSTYRLYVSIADVSHYVKFGKPMDVEAYNRGTSVYAADLAVPMLPEKLSSGLCSLRPGELRLTLTAEMRVDQNGHLTHHALYPSYIRSHARMTYTCVNKILEHDEDARKEYSELTEMLEEMKELSGKIRHLREKNGAIDFDTEESCFSFGDDGEITGVYPRERKDSEKIIEDFMILANTAVAKTLLEKKIPGMFRVHDKPSERRMKDLVHLVSVFGYRWKGGTEVLMPSQFRDLLEWAKDDPAFPVISMMTLRSMAKAKYSDECSGHFGLAIEEYTHFTSPIRRYPDLFVHRMLHKYLFDNNSKGEENDRIYAAKAAEQSSLKERNANDAELAVNDYLCALYMTNHLNEVFTGTVSFVSQKGIYVRLPSTVEGLVPIESMRDDYYTFNPGKYTLYGTETGKTYSIGDEVSVRLVRTDPYEPSIHFEFVSGPSLEKESENGQRKRRSKGNRR